MLYYIILSVLETWISKVSTLHIDKRGTKRWFDENGNLHRLDGPAVEYADGSCAWFIDGKYHRLDGPAVERKNDQFGWWVNGKPVPEKDHPFVKLLKKYRLYARWKRKELTKDDWILIKMSICDV